MASESNGQPACRHTTACLRIGDNVMRISAIVLLLFAAVELANRPATAADDVCGMACCDQCGRHVFCLHKTCQVVCEIKKETKTCWCVECKEICPLLPGRRCQSDECPPPPRCGEPKCVKTLVKKQYQVEVPVYKCVTRNLCSECFKGGSADVRGAAPSAPAPPTAPAMPPAPPAPTPPSRVPR